VDLDKVDGNSNVLTADVSDLNEDESVTRSGKVSIDNVPNDGDEVEEEKRTSTKDRLKQIALEERRQVNEMTKNMRKAASTTTDIVSEINNNEDQEEEKKGEELVWEIEECPHLVTDECPPTKKYKKNFKAYIKRIRNARKCKGWKMELLVEFNTGERQWSMFHGPLIDFESPTAKFMKDCGLTLSICGYKLDPKKMTKKK
jgi:hypothetical protein